jgi:hypothetical protein
VSTKAARRAVSKMEPYEISAGVSRVVADNCKNDMKLISETIPAKNNQNIKLDCNLEESHFIRQWIRYVATRTDAYPEYSHMCAVSLLSVVAMRKVVLPLDTGITYTNIWSLGLGESSTSRKSTSIDILNEVLGANYQDKKLPDSFSSEAFIEQIAKKQQCYQVLSEAGGLLKDVNAKKYLAGVKDFLCEIYGNTKFQRTLRTSQRTNSVTDFNIEKPYLSFVWTTTYETFEKSTSADDVGSGLLARFLIFAPKYKKNIKKIGIMTTDMTNGIFALDQRYRKIKNAIEGIKGKLELIPSERSLELYNNWDADSQNKIMEGIANKYQKTIHSRMLIYAFKLAAIYYIGSERFLQDIETAREIEMPEETPLDKQSEWVHTIRLSLPDEYSEEALRVIVEYFDPVSVRILNDLAVTEAGNIQERIIKLIRDNGGKMQKRDVIRSMRIKSTDMEGHLKALYDGQSVTEEPGSSPAMLYLTET